MKQLQRMAPGCRACEVFQFSGMNRHQQTAIFTASDYALALHCWSCEESYGF